MDDTNIGALYAALAKAQGAFKAITKNREVMITMKSGGKYKFRYADLEEITACTRPALSANGLSLIQPVQSDPATGATWVETTLMHADGGRITSRIDIKPAATYADPKEFGATVTYIRRYGISSLLGVAADDDLDGNGRGAGDGDDKGHGDTEAAQISAMVDELIAAAKRTTTDAEALKFWRDNNAKLAKWPNSHEELKSAVAKHRHALAAQTAGATT